MIVAKKGKLTKTFSPLSWENLGTDKGGWVEAEGVITVNAVKSVAATPKKEATIPNLVTENIVNKPAPVEEVKTEDVKADPEPDKASEIENFIAGQKEAFNETAKPLTKGLIKDYFDLNEVSYKANDGLPVLLDILFDKLNGDVELLKSNFNL